MTVLVTGGAGYIGSHMVLALVDAGEKVVVIDNLSTGFPWLLPPGVALRGGDIGDPAFVAAVIEEFGVTEIAHFAARIVVPESMVKPLLYYGNNTAKSRALFETALRHGVKRVIFSSTAAVYGDVSGDPVTEETPPAPVSPYGRSKLMSEWMLEDAAKAHGLDYVILRYFNVAGADPQGRSGQSFANSTHLIKVAVQTALGQREKMEIDVYKRQPDSGAILVDWAMRYQNPSTEARINALMAQGCDRILLVPLYPQYAAATTATANDEAFRALMKMRWQPYVRIAPAYADEPAYIAALAQSVRAHLATLDWAPEILLATFHGMPQKYLEAGDPYHCECLKTARLLREALGWPQERFRVTFQSRFGNDPWLQPYTDETVKALARGGTRRLALIAPGFSADCLETLEELDVENRAIFMENGGEMFSYIPALNASAGGIDVIEAIVRRELMGWAGA